MCDFRKMVSEYKKFYDMVMEIHANPRAYDFSTVQRLDSEEDARVYMYILPLLCRLKKAPHKNLLSAVLPNDHRSTEAHYQKAVKLFKVFQKTRGKPISYCEMDRQNFYFGAVPSAVAKDIIKTNTACGLGRGDGRGYCDHNFDYTVIVCLR